MEQDKTRPAFTSRMRGYELAAALVYIPIHVLGVPMLLGWLFAEGRISSVGVNTLYYIIGAAYMLVFLWRFFRTEFYSLCDYGFGFVLEILKSYGIMILCSLVVNGALMAAGFSSNPNNEAIFEMAGEDIAHTAAIAVFLAPIVEEPMFRGGIFGLIRRKSRFAAYAVSMLAFGAYHVWGYVGSAPLTWLYVLQYLPISFLLARCYEKTNSIWTSIFLHMTVNGISMLAVSALGELL